MSDVFHDRQARGWTRTGWLQAHHTFSFGSFNDPTRMGFRALRVINEDVIAGGSGFSEHGHDHFEILTFLLSGEIEHKDSAGHAGRLRAGDVQLISSGTGIKHSERNPSSQHSAHAFQIWVHGNADASPPRYQVLSGGLINGASPRLIASPMELEGALQIRAPVSIWAASGQLGESCTHEISSDRYGWLQVLEGIVMVDVDGEPSPLELRGGDALQLSSVKQVALRPHIEARWLWFDLP